MRHRRTTNENKMLSKMENMISMMATEKPFERLQSLEQKINEVDKIQTIENYIAQLKERIWAVLTTAEASAYLGLSESYIYKLTSLKQIPHYKPNGKLVYFNRKELCEWAMRNQVQTIGQPAAITREEL